MRTSCVADILNRGRQSIPAAACSSRARSRPMWHCAAVASLTFLGAAQTVTGSRHLLTTASGKRVLIDAGLFQGRKELRLRNWAPWTSGQLDAVVLTHAHIDHTGFLPRLCAQGLVRRALCTDATRDLAWLLLPDSGHLQEEEARYANRHGYSKHHPALPLYTAAQAETAARRLEGFRYDVPVEVVDGVQVTFHQAGHILGSAFPDVRVDGKRILFSGDLGRYGTSVPVRAKVVQMTGFSAHADWMEEDRWLARAPSPPDRVFFVHGEPPAIEAQRARLSAKGWRVEAPQPGQEVQL